MRVVALEEHFVTAPVLAAWEAVEPRWQDLSLGPSRDGSTGRRLLDLGAERLAEMDGAGVDVHVLSLSTPGVANLPPGQAVALQRDSNDELAEAVRSRPDRYGGLATLATPAPDRAAAELERAVTTLGLDGAMVFGRTRDRSLDHRDFWPIFEAAEALNAPLYLHPQTPPRAVRAAYYDGFGPLTDAAFATHAIGWHYDAGVQLVRLIVAGVFDRFPRLRVIVGHWGEVVLFQLERIDELAAVAKLRRTPSECVRENVFVTPSGILSERYLRWAVEVVGVEHVLFATDHPFVPLGTRDPRRFLEESGLTDAGREMVASANWERIRTDIRGRSC